MVAASDTGSFIFHSAPWNVRIGNVIGFTADERSFGEHVIATSAKTSPIDEVSMLKARTIDHGLRAEGRICLSSLPTVY